MDTDITRQCRSCGAPFTITAHEATWYRSQQAARDDPRGSWQLPWRCAPCRQARRAVPVVADDSDAGDAIICVGCRGTFVFSAGERRYYASRGLRVPRRCPACRAARRLAGA